MSTFPPQGQILSVAGTNIANSYVAAGTSATLEAGRRTKRLRVYVRVVTAVGSNLTTITAKLQHRYNDPTGAANGGPLTLGWQDLPSTLNDVQGAAQPKGSTFEIEHAFTVAANQTNDFSFYLDEPEGIPDLQCLVKANAAGIAGDSITVYAAAGRWV